MTTDFLTGTVKGPGEMPHEYLFITKDNTKTRIGEFVYYTVKVGDETRQIIGTIKSRKLVRNCAAFCPTRTRRLDGSALSVLDGDGAALRNNVETIAISARR